MSSMSRANPPVAIRLSFAAALALALPLTSLTSPHAAAAAAGVSQLQLSQGSTTIKKIGPSRTTSRAEVATTLPAGPLDFGVQFRAASTTSGYRAQVSVDQKGTVSGSFTRLDSGAATPLKAATKLPLTAQPGEIVHVEATVAAKKVVKLYLKAWKYGTAKPANWQLTTSDSSAKRYSSPGSTYFWAKQNQQAKVGLSYRTVSVNPYTAAKAQAAGVKLGAGTAASMSNSFSIAVIPDTQRETGATTPSPFVNRTQWLAKNANAYRLQYALHTGDITDWGWLEPAQLNRAKTAMNVLSRAGIPYSLAVGNHDTQAVGWNGLANSTGYGGSAYMYNPECPSRLGSSECKSWLLVRNTTALNRTFPLSSFKNINGVYEAGKIDNHWSSFSVSGTNWLVLSLELWPRKQVVEWAKRVVASHPHHNVIIETHSYLTSSGSIYTKNGGYGETSPSYLYSNLVKKYSNIKLVFSGHTGKFTSRTDTIGKNKVVSYLGNELGKSGDNPVRVVTINPVTGAVTTTIYNPLRSASAGATSHTISIAR